MRPLSPASSFPSTPDFHGLVCHSGRSEASALTFSFPPVISTNRRNLRHRSLQLAEEDAAIGAGACAGATTARTTVNGVPQPVAEGEIVVGPNGEPPSRFRRDT